MLRLKQYFPDKVNLFA
jgi:hypothetical protein